MLKLLQERFEYFYRTLKKTGLDDKVKEAYDKLS